MPGEEGSSERVFYGGTTKAEILERGNDRIGIQHWARDGITGIFLSLPALRAHASEADRFTWKAVEF